MKVKRSNLVPTLVPEASDEEIRDAAPLATRGQELALSVVDEDSYRAAAELLTGSVEPMIKRVDAFFADMLSEQKEAIAKQKKALRAIEDRRDQVRDPLLSAKDAIKGALGSYRRRLIDARAAVERRIAEEATRRSGDTATPAPSLFLAAVSREELPTAPGISVRDVWILGAIIDPGGLKPEYLAPDERKIKAVVKALGADAVKAVSVDPERPAISVERDTWIASRSTAGG